MTFAKSYLCYQLFVSARVDEHSLRQSSGRRHLLDRVRVPESCLRICCHSFDYQILSERKIRADVWLLAGVVVCRNLILLKVAADGDSFDYQASI